MNTTDPTTPELQRLAEEAAALLNSCSRRMTSVEIESCRRIADGRATPDDLLALKFCRPLLTRDLHTAAPVVAAGAA